MTTSLSLADWLHDHQAQILSRWLAWLEQSAAYNGNTLPALEAQTVAVVSHPDEPRILLESLYQGFIQAARGDDHPLQENLRLLRAFRTSHSEQDLPRMLELVGQLRFIAGNQLSNSSNEGDQADRTQIRTELDRLIDHATTMLATAWVDRAALIERELQETKMLVESLYRDAEATDRTTMHVSQLNELSRSLATSLDQSQQFHLIGSHLKQSLQVASLGIWHQTTEQLQLAYLWDEAHTGQYRAEPAHTLAVDDPNDMIAQAQRNGDMVIKVAADPETQGSWHLPNHVVLAIPFSNQNGVVVLQDVSGTLLLDRSEQEFLRSVISQASIALENARLYAEVRSFNTVLEQRIAERTRELQIERDTLETLNTIALEISSSLDERLLMESSLTAVAQLVGASHGSINLLDRETDQLVDSAVLGDSGERGYVRFPIGSGIIGWSAQHRKTVIVSDVSVDPRWVEYPHDENDQIKHQGSMIAVPLMAHHELQGVLVLSHDDIGYFSESHGRLTEAAANQIATGIYNALMYKQVELDLLRRYEMQQIQEQAVSQSNAILQSLSDGVIVCDSFGSVITVNPAAERILDRPLEELLIWNMPELFRRLMGRRADELPIDNLLSEPHDPQGNPLVFSTTFQIGVRMVSITLNPVLSSEKHKPLGALAVFRDITREVESDRLKTEFIGTVSHELRTPMTSIKGFTQLLVMGSLGPVNDTQREFLNIIQNNAERMIAIINDLLDITKIETGSVELDLRPLHLAESLSGVMLELQPKIVERNLDLTLSIPPGLPLVRADQRRFNQILYNLLSNAVKYTPRGGQINLDAHEILIDDIPERLREGLKDRRFVQVDIRDTGVGIAPEDLDRIFERFYRTENPLKVEAGGTGLGLALVRPLANLFRGRVWVTSALNEGSTFSLVVPAL